VTPGNSSQITDGAAWLLLASAAAVEKWHLQPLGRITDSQWAGLDPAAMGLGPVHAATPILQRQQFALNDIDLWEINEAFAAQVLACVAAWESDAYCRRGTRLPGALGVARADRLNVDGSRDCPRSPGRGFRRAHRPASAACAARGQGAGAASRRSASAAGRAARCSWKRSA
jgi:acetyl-CoA C-acetyltransferase